MPGTLFPKLPAITAAERSPRLSTPGTSFPVLTLLRNLVNFECLRSARSSREGEVHEALKIHEMLEKYFELLEALLKSGDFVGDVKIVGKIHGTIDCKENPLTRRFVRSSSCRSTTSKSSTFQP